MQVFFLGKMVVLGCVVCLCFCHDLIIDTCYSRSMQLNTFQCVVATDGEMTFAIFLYNKLDWSQGQNTSVARVGFYGIEAVFF